MATFVVLFPQIDNGCEMFGWMAKYWQALSNPRVDEEVIEKRLRELKNRLPTPVVWLLGKAQSGKTSIVHALTGHPRAEIGNGYQPCTKTSFRYAFPNQEFPLIEFLDTRGLDDASYDSNEDIKWHEEQSHLVMVVMRAVDHAQRSVRAVLSSIRNRRPDWPVIVVQTCLHEGYPWREPRHILPYPFDKDPLPSSIPADLTRSLLAQRAWFRNDPVHFVAIDFTLPEDGFTPRFYGLEQLWQTLEEVFPHGIWGMLKESVDVRQRLGEIYSQAAEETIWAHSLLAATAGVVPIPALDIPVIVAIQFHMAQQIARIYGQRLDHKRWLDLVGTLGWSFLTRMGVRELMKFLPWIGVPSAVVFMGVSTYALGQLLSWYFAEIRRGHLPDKATLQQLYRQEWDRAQQHMASQFEAFGKGKANTEQG